MFWGLAGRDQGTNLVGRVQELWDARVNSLPSENRANDACTVREENSGGRFVQRLTGIPKRRRQKNTWQELTNCKNTKNRPIFTLQTRSLLCFTCSSPLLVRVTWKDPSRVHREKRFFFFVFSCSGRSHRVNISTHVASSVDASVDASADGRACAPSCVPA